MYQTMLSQPEVMRRVREDTAEQVALAAEILRLARRVRLTGTGTSSHAAVVGAHLLRGVGVDATATTNFDFAHYDPPPTPEDAVLAISHRGGKRFGVAAAERALGAGAPLIGVVGQGAALPGAQVLLHTAPQERSSAHTASYTANLAALASLAVGAGELAAADVSALRSALDTLPDAVAALLRREDELRPVAETLAARGRLVLIGAGPNAVTAREGALKIKETSYLVAEGLELETALHGPLQAVESGDVAAVILAHGPALHRSLDAVRALGVIGARLLLIADDTAAGRLRELALPEDATLITHAHVPEALSPALAVVPLQLLAVLTAELRGTDPDNFRAEDPRYREATASYEL
jgi:glucosamine--fructose-6-phosphate aminotransferase (isomerizing)